MLYFDNLAIKTREDYSANNNTIRHMRRQSSCLRVSSVRSYRFFHEAPQGGAPDRARMCQQNIPGLCWPPALLGTGLPYTFYSSNRAERFNRQYREQWYYSTGKTELSGTYLTGTLESSGTLLTAP